MNWKLERVCNDCVTIYNAKRGDKIIQTFFVVDGDGYDYTDDQARSILKEQIDTEGELNQ